MNIFVLDNNHSLNAMYHCDKHVRKMILETAQLLCTAHWMTGNKAPYKKTHYNHPCAKWTRESIHNYVWLAKLGKALCKEFTFRWNKRHKTEDVIDWCQANIPNLPWVSSTPFALAMPDQYRNGSAVSSYRDYYRNDKKELLDYTKRDSPPWL